jgi:hypothetical protein
VAKKQKLAAYRAKRDFKKTSEPSGKGTVRRAQFPRLIVQASPLSKCKLPLPPRERA